jgi:hypothetical protein
VRERGKYAYRKCVGEVAQKERSVKKNVALLNERRRDGD